MADKDKYGLAPAASASSYGLAPAGQAPASDEEPPTDEEISAGAPDATPQLKAAIKSGAAKMSKPTNLEETFKAEHPNWDTKGSDLGNIAGNVYQGAAGAIGGTAGLVKDAGRLGLSGITGENPIDVGKELAKKYVTEPGAAELAKGREEMAAGHTMSGIGHSVAGAIPMIGPFAASVGEQAGAGDIGGAAGQLAGAALGGKAMEHAPTAVPKAISKTADLTGGFGMGLGLPGEDLITKGVRPSNRAQGWSEALADPGAQRAIKEADAQNPIRNKEDFHDAIGPMKEKVWNEQVQPALDRQGPRPIDMAPAAAGVRAAITPQMREFKPQMVEQLEDLAGKLDRSRTVQEASDLQKMANNEVQGYFAKFPTARRAAMQANPDILGWETARQGIRDVLNKTMDDNKETQAAPGRATYGHLTAIEKELEKKTNVTERKSPIDLAQMMGLIGALPTHGASVIAGQVIHHMNDQDVLLRRGIKKLNPPEAPAFQAPAPYTPPLNQFPQGQGALPPAAAVAPIQGAAPPPKPFQIENMRPNQTGMWQQQVGRPPELQNPAPSPPYYPSIGPKPAAEIPSGPIHGEQMPLDIPRRGEAPLFHMEQTGAVGAHPVPEAPPEPIHGEQMPLNIPHGNEAPLFNAPEQTRNVPAIPKLPGEGRPGVGMGQEPLPPIGGPGRVGTLSKIGEGAPKHEGVKIQEGQDIGSGLGTEHIVTKDGERVGSVTVEPRDEGKLHVHWMSGDFGRSAIRGMIEDLRELYPDTDTITYDRRRVSKNGLTATTEQREMKMPERIGGEKGDWDAISGEVSNALKEEEMSKEKFAENTKEEKRLPQLKMNRAMQPEGGMLPGERAPRTRPAGRGMEAFGRPRPEIVPEEATKPVETYGSQAESDAAKKASTVPLMESPLKIKGVGGGKPSTLDVAKALNKFTKSQVPALALDKAEPVEMTTRAKAIAEDEAKYQLAQDNAGAAWYTTDMADHDKYLREMRPSLEDPAKLSMFKMNEAILSSGQKPYGNFKAALKAWDAYEKTGEFPRTQPDSGKSWGPRGVDSYGNAIDYLNRLIKEHGEEGASNWLLADHPVSELREYNKDVGGKKDDVRPGVMILGDKRGPFAQNLHGIESAFTVDMWVSRSWNRWMGTIEHNAEGEITTDKPRNDKERALMKESFSHVADKLGLSTSALQAVLWYYEQGLYDVHGTPKESWSFADAAKRVADEQAGRPTTTKSGKAVKTSARAGSSVRTSGEPPQ